MAPSVAPLLSTALNGQTSGESSVKVPWWKDAVVYQIYPRSFCDSNNDGFGDLRGILSKIDYLQKLGVGVVWLCPVFKSPQTDMGYDISDYYEIDSLFGTMEDWQNLVDELHKKGIKLIMDLVVNHTSIQHQWFLESRSNKVNNKRDWYHWRPPIYDKDGNRHPPNNWRSFFGSDSAWEYDANTEEYYLRVFTKDQPDLNWENQQVRTAVADVVNFWLDKGVDGFRLDAINYICKSESYPDAAVVEEETPFQPAMHLYMNNGNVHEYIRELNLNSFAKHHGSKMTVGETPYVDSKLALDYVKPDRQECNMIFQWEHMDVDRIPNSLLGWKPWKLSKLKSILSDWQQSMFDKNGWNAIYFENHDQGRSISRFASDSEEYRVQSGKLLAMMLSTLSGTLYIYQGQEIGMINPKNWPIDYYPDVVTNTYYEQEIKQHSNVEPEHLDKIMFDIRRKGRDNSRTPIPWNGKSAGAGFTGGDPWVRINPDFETCNVENAMSDESSVWNFWREILSVRKNKYPAMVHGSFTLVDPENPFIFAYMKHLPAAESLLVVLNFSGTCTSWTIPTEFAIKQAQVVIGNYQDTPEYEKLTSLRPWEGVIYSCTN